MERKIEAKSGLIYNSALEGLTNQQWQLQRLQEEGHNVTPLLEENWEKIKELIEIDDQERLGHLRQELKNL